MAGLHKAQKHFGQQRLRDILHIERLSEVHAAESVAFVAKALALADAVPVKEDVIDDPNCQRKVLKAVKLALRSVTSLAAKSDGLWDSNESGGIDESMSGVQR